jgi:hypothetical protein
MADPVSISLRQVSAAAKVTVAKALEQHQAKIPRPNYRLGYFPPHWWFGFVIYKPDLGQLSLGEAQKLATDVHTGIAASVAVTKGGKAGAFIGDGNLTIGFAPPIEINLIEE